MTLVWRRLLMPAASTRAAATAANASASGVVQAGQGKLVKRKAAALASPSMATGPAPLPLARYTGSAATGRGAVLPGARRGAGRALVGRTGLPLAGVGLRRTTSVAMTKEAASASSQRARSGRRTGAGGRGLRTED